LGSPDEDPPPRVDPDFSLSTASGGRLEDPEGYYDSIADILQAAVYAGWNAEDLCRHALSLQAQIKLEGEMGSRSARGPRDLRGLRVRGRKNRGPSTRRCLTTTVIVDGGTSAEVSPPRALGSGFGVAGLASRSSLHRCGGTSMAVRGLMGRAL
jgi:hypothetical protein